MNLNSWTLGDDVALYTFVVVQCTVYKSKYIKPYIKSYIAFIERLLGVDSRLHSG